MNRLRCRADIEQLFKTANTLMDSEALVQDESRVRTISHLLHPPLLDEAGFGICPEMYVDDIYGTQWH